jgi:hypothetical protein
MGENALGASISWCQLATTGDTVVVVSRSQNESSYNIDTFRWQGTNLVRDKQISIIVSIIFG